MHRSVQSWLESQRRRIVNPVDFQFWHPTSTVLVIFQCVHTDCAKLERKLPRRLILAVLIRVVDCVGAGGHG
jgi:hypothetical protein